MQQITSNKMLYGHQRFLLVVFFIIALLFVMFLVSTDMRYYSTGRQPLFQAAEWGFFAALVIAFCYLAVVCPARQMLLRQARLKEYRSSIDRKSAILNAGPDAMIAFDEEFVIEEWNTLAVQMLSWKKEEVVGRLLTETVLPDQYGQKLARSMSRYMSTGRHRLIGRRIRLDATSRDGSQVPLEITVSPFMDEGRTCFVARLQNRVARANHDPLTGVCTRTLLMDRLGQSIKRADRKKEKVGLVYINLSKFKIINNTFGNDAGDAILKETVERLKKLIRGSDTLARLGGDEFAIVVPEMKDSVFTRDIVQRLVKVIDRPYGVDQCEIPMHASIGVAVYPDDATEKDALLLKADCAMHNAREVVQSTDCTGYVFFSSEMDHDIDWSLHVIRNLEAAIRDGQLYMEYQPKDSLIHHRVTGVEALVRWRHPELGIIPPFKFIEIAEKANMIQMISDFVLEQTVRTTELLKADTKRPVTVAMNISAQQHLDAAFLAGIDKAIEGTGASLCDLEIELTESMLIQNIPETTATLRALQQRGMKIGVDDFGTGYSSLNYLSKFPLNYLKIDPSFMKNVPDDPQMSSIVTAIISMAHSLQLEVIAEGIEQPEQIHWLRERGCQHLQGFYLSPAVTYDQLLATIRQVESDELLRKYADEMPSELVTA